MKEKHPINMQHCRGISSCGSYAPDEIPNSMFLPLMKKLSWGRLQKWSIFSYDRYSAPPPLLSVMTQGQNLLGEGGKNFFCALWSQFCPRRKKSWTRLCNKVHSNIYSLFRISKHLIYHYYNHLHRRIIKMDVLLMIQRKIWR